MKPTSDGGMDDDSPNDVFFFLSFIIEFLKLDLIVFLSVTTTLTANGRFPLSAAGAEVELESSDSHLLAQCLHAGGLSEGDGGAASAQIPPGNLHTDCRGAFRAAEVTLLIHPMLHLSQTLF